MVSSCLVIALLLIFGSTPRAEVPGEFNYQGYLTDTDGIPIGIAFPVQVQMWFSIYDQETEGVEMWSEGPLTVSVEDGVFNVILGQTNPVAPGDLDGSCWLEVIVDGEYLVPRERVVSSLFAIEAMDADTLDGLDSLDFAEASHGHSFTELTDTATDAQIPDDITILNAGLVDGYEGADLEESSEIDADIATHAAETSAHHAKTTSFLELTDTAADAQIPDDITVEYATASGSADSATYATTSGDSDTLDGDHSSDFASAEHDHDDRYYTKHLYGLSGSGAIPGVFNIKDYHATGDGETDDRAAIQRAIDEADLIGGGIVFVPPAEYEYRICDPLAIRNSNIRITGVGERSHIRGYQDCYTSSTQLPVIAVSGSPTENVEISHLKLTFTCSTVVPDPGRPGVIKTVNGSTISNLRIHDNIITTNGVNGIALDGVVDNFWIENNHINEVGYDGMYLGGLSSNGHIKGNRIYTSSTAPYPASTSGIAVKNGDGLVISENIIEGAFRIAGIEFGDWPVNDILIRGNIIRYFTDTGAEGIYTNCCLHGGENPTQSNIRIEENLIDTVPFGIHILETGTGVIENVVVSKNTVVHTDWRAILFERFGTGHMSDVHIQDNICKQTTQGIQVDGVNGFTSVTGNVINRIDVSATMGLRFLNIPENTVIATENVVHNYATQIDTDVYQRNNFFSFPTNNGKVFSTQVDGPIETAGDEVVASLQVPAGSY